MGAQHIHPTETTAERTESPSDTVTPEPQVAGLPVTTGETADIEEFV
ncbi:hypothetical protein SAMN05216184_11249 [Georgenia satyanarayanai]|uniref:Uncharacterized protein n=1 Tax=Georgenia satyanarayanai TaxID=860221 RepID=A0A2Y9ALJ3_9MICO|nr:hypothetical protein [Georgenia satyanarayanai]PYF98305.1 hypothetical protein A8987_11249 [Georgenia satyanarayanai]SSA45190.1 hypothetical protein SAMN05216184_11249 [Georgenia satyanarayanai]